MRSVNFVDAHDGFTLADLVSYDDKHNLDNGEDNRDGNAQNDSWNCGVEGPTDDPAVEALRQRQLRSFFTVLLLSQGRPMFVMGDEVRRTQQGNNNAYCQDNEISWFDWDLVDRNPHLFDFVSRLLRFRRLSPFFQDDRFWSRARRRRHHLARRGGRPPGLGGLVALAGLRADALDATPAPTCTWPSTPSGSRSSSQLPAVARGSGLGAGRRHRRAGARRRARPAATAARRHGPLPGRAPDRPRSSVRFRLGGDGRHRTHLERVGHDPGGSSRSRSGSQ